MKHFKDVKPGDMIYILDTKPQENIIVGPDFEKRPEKYVKNAIFERQVTESFVHPKSKNKRVWVIKAYAAVRSPMAISNEALDKAKEIGVANTITTFYVPSDADFVSVMTLPLMTVMATTKESIERWMQKTK